MKTLDKRHEDRARRKADNATDPAATLPGVSVGSVVDAFRTALTLAGRLSAEDRERAMANVSELKPEDFIGVSLAEAEDGSTMAGIGVVNPFVVPNTAFQQTPPLPESELDPNDGRNLNGVALEEQTGLGTNAGSAWGSTGGEQAGAGAGDGTGTTTEAAPAASGKAPSGKAGSGK